MDNDVLKKAGLMLVNNSIISTISYIDIEGYPVSKAMIVFKHTGLEEFWFFSHKSSSKVCQFCVNSKSSLYFQDYIDHIALSLVGTVEILDDLENKLSFWKDSLKSTFTGGVEDPELIVIKFVSVKGTYFDSKYSYDFNI